MLAMKRFPPRPSLSALRSADPQRAFVDDRVGPSAGDQLILVNCIAGALNERDEDIQGPAAEA
jgi:hypothetical protein